MFNQKGAIGALILIGIVVIVGGIILSGVLNKRNDGSTGGDLDDDEEEDDNEETCGNGICDNLETQVSCSFDCAEIPLPPEPEEAFLECATGDEAMPRVLYSWKWDAPMRICDVGEVENARFCDATQFSISFLKKLNEFYEGDLPIEQVTNQEVYLMKTAFSDDFVADFDETNRIFGGFADTPVFYKDDETGLWKTFKSIHFEGEISSPGKYRVTVENLPSTPLDEEIEQNTAQECQEVGECKQWVDVETCQGGRTCTQGYCSATCNNCGGVAEGTKQCLPESGITGATLRSCEWSAQTECLEWTQVDTCGQRVCDTGEDGELACIDITEGTCADSEVLARQCTEKTINGERKSVVEQCDAVYDSVEQRWEKNWTQVQICQAACSDGECNEGGAAGENTPQDGTVFFQENPSTVWAVIYTRIFPDNSLVVNVEGAKVTFLQGEEEFETTDTDEQGASGQVSFEKGTEVRVRVEKNGYETITSQPVIVPVDREQLAVTVEITPNSLKNLAVSVKNSENESAVAGASVMLTGMGILLEGETNIAGAKSWNDIPSGIYNVSVSKEGFSDFTETIDEGTQDFAVLLEPPTECADTCETIGVRQCSAEIIVKFELIEAIGENNPFYYLPFEGFTGRGSIVHPGEADRLQRFEYGIGFSVDEEDQIMVGPANTYSAQNNGNGKFLTTFSFDDSMERLVGSETRGTILEIKVKDNSTEREVIFSPSVATPVLLEIDTGQTEDLTQASLTVHYEYRLPEGKTFENAENTTKWESIATCSAVPGGMSTFLNYYDSKTEAQGNIGTFYRVFFNPLWENPDKDDATEKALQPDKTKIAAQTVFYSATGEDSPVVEFKKLSSGEEEITNGVKFYAPGTPNPQAGTSILLAGTPEHPSNKRASFIRSFNDVLSLVLDGRACLSTAKKDGYTVATVKWVEQELLDESLANQAADLKNTCFTDERGVDCSNIQNSLGENISCAAFTEGTKRCSAISNGGVTTDTVEECKTDSETGCLVWTFSKSCRDSACNTASGQAACAE